MGKNCSQAASASAQGALRSRDRGRVAVKSAMKAAVKALIDLGKRDWDALEFSPVFQCLEDSKLYNQFSSDCVDACPAGSEQKRGQCVRPEKYKWSHFRSTWSMAVDCAEGCWESKKGVSIHS